MKYILPLIFSLIFSSFAWAESKTDINDLEARAKDGDVEAQFMLGAAYDGGVGVRANGRKAKKWYGKAAENGHIEAQNSLGSGYQAEKKYTDAKFWYEKASAQGHALATHNLAFLYDLGYGVKQDRLKAEKLYLRAADLGEAQAMYNLGQSYGSGIIGPVDLDKGCFWTYLAKRFANPDDDALTQRTRQTINYCENTLSHGKIQKIKSRVGEWTPKEN